MRPQSQARGRRRLLLITCLMALGLAAPAVATPARAATPVAAAALVRSAIVARDAVTGTVTTAPEQALTGTTGLTTVRLPYQVTTGAALLIQVHTLPGARVTLMIGFPDGTTVLRSRRAGPAGYADFAPTVAYQPQGSAESATVMVTARLPRAHLDDIIQGTVTVLQHIVLQGYLKLPGAVTVGRPLTITVVSNHPGAIVRFLLTYPDGQAESGSGVTDATGILTRSFPVSRSDGTIGGLDVQVWLSYQGVQRHFDRRVALRARKP